MQNQSPLNKTKDVAITIRMDIRHVEMRHVQKYPFGQQQPAPESVVHLVKYFQQHEYEQSKTLIASHEQLSHPNLIQVIKAIESKRARKFELFYEVVPFSLSSRIKLLTNSELNQIRESLCNLAEYLICRGFLPQFESQSLGLTSRNIIKYLLPINRKQIEPSHDKSDLFLRKREQVNALMLEITKTLRELPSEQQFHKVVNPQFSKTTKSGSLMVHSVQRPSEKPSNDGLLSPQQRNSHVIQDVKKSMSFQSLSKQQPGKLAIQKLGRGSLTPIIESVGVTNSNSQILNNIDPLTKLKSIDRRIKQLEGTKNIMDTNERRNQQQLKQVRRSQIPQVQSKMPSSILQQQDSPKMSKPIPKNVQPQPSPPAQKKPKKQFDQDSQDTYRQELGENIEMPKITSNTEMRNTTMSPPKLFNDRGKDKLSESVGYNQQIPLPVIAAGSAYSEQTDNKTLTIQNTSIRTANDLQAKPAKKPTQNIVTKSKQQLQSPFQKQRYQIQIPQVLSSAQLEQIISNSPQLQQQLPHMQVPHNLNVNVNVAVNLSDLSKKVDAAQGRIRTTSQTNESGLKSPAGKVKQITCQLNNPKQEPRMQTHVSSKKQQHEPHQNQRPTHPIQSKSSNVLGKSTANVNNLKHKPPPHEKPTTSTVNPMDLHLSKNRKHSDTTPKLVLLSPTRLQFKKPSQPQIAERPKDHAPDVKQVPKHSNNTLEAPASYIRKDSGQQIQKDFRELHKSKQKTDEPAVCEGEKSREYLYHYQNLFPDVPNDYNDDVSVRNPQALQSHLDELYSQSLKFDKNDALISEFTTLFEADSVHKGPTGSRSGDVSPKSIDQSAPRTENLSMVNEQESRNKHINQRVKLALKKSEATLEHFGKIKKGHPNS